MSKILDLFSENPQVTQAIAKSVPAIMGMYQANKAKGAMEKYQTALDNIEKNRQEIVNPYAIKKNAIKKILNKSIFKTYLHNLKYIEDLSIVEQKKITKLKKLKKLKKN